jgi:hypothetical protein
MFFYLAIVTERMCVGVTLSSDALIYENEGAYPDCRLRHLCVKHRASASV